MDPSPTSPPGLDLGALEPLLADGLGPRREVPYTASIVPGGKSNVTYFVTWGDREVVLRRPPLGPHDPRNHDVGREHRVLTALADSSLPTPRPLLHEPTGSVIGAPFYVMERIPGRVVKLADDHPDLHRPERLDAIGDALIDGLVALHAIDPAEVGLGDLGRPEGYIERQVDRWAGQWEQAQQRPIPALDEIGRRLRAALAAGGVRSEPDRPHLVHGDYNLGNVIIAEAAELDAADDGTLLRAVLDWEMATRGHPLMDLGVLCSYNGPHGDRIYEMDGVVSSLPGFPSPSDLVERYGHRSGRDVSDARFFEVLAFYKVLVITEDVRSRHLAGGTVGEGYELMGRSVPDLAEILLEIARTSTVPGLRS